MEESTHIGNILPLGGAQMAETSKLAATIRTARKRAGLTQLDLADLAEVSERTVRAIESDTGNPSLKAVASVLNVLGLKLTVI